MKYVKFGEKKNGRYTKSEEMYIATFEVWLKSISPVYKIPKKDLWSKITGKTKQQETWNEAYQQGYKDFREQLVNKIKITIDEDRKEKKQKVIIMKNIIFIKNTKKKRRQ